MKEHKNDNSHDVEISRSMFQNYSTENSYYHMGDEDPYQTITGFDEIVHSPIDSLFNDGVGGIEEVDAQVMHWQSNPVGTKEVNNQITFGENYTVLPSNYNDERIF